jgi:hypothetical protein
LIPDEFRDEPELKQTIAKRPLAFEFVEQAGLEIDPRFARSQARATVDVTALENVTRPKKRPYWGYELRVARDQDIDPLWAELKAVWPNVHDLKPTDYLYWLLLECSKSALAVNDRARALFLLAIRYGFIKSAGALLPKFRPTKAEVLDFAHSIKRCLQIDPFGLSLKQFEEWHATLRQAFTQADQPGRFSFDDRLAVHEILKGRLVTAQRGLSRRAAQLFFRKSHYPIQVQSLREFYEQTVDLMRPGLGAVNAGAVIERISELPRSPLGSSVYASVLRTGDRFDVLVISRNGRSVTGSASVGQVCAEARSLREEHEVWLANHGAPFDQQMPWHEDFFIFAEHVLELAFQCDKQMGTLTLALDNELAGLPWQHLFLVVSRVVYGRALVITIVPNLGLVTLKAPKDFEKKDGLDLFLARDDASLVEVVHEIEERAVQLMGRGVNVSIVVGHGELPPGAALPSVKTGGKPIELLEDWHRIISRRVVIIHSCFGALPSRWSLGDFGALPGLALGLGCQALIGPISQVPKSTALVLSRHLLAPSGSIDIASRYLAAIEEDHRVCLYTIFGSPLASLFNSEENTRALGESVAA